MISKPSIKFKSLNQWRSTNIKVVGERPLIDILNKLVTNYPTKLYANQSRWIPLSCNGMPFYGRHHSHCVLLQKMNITNCVFITNLFIVYPFPKHDFADVWYIQNKTKCFPDLSFFCCYHTNVIMIVLAIFNNVASV